MPPFMPFTYPAGYSGTGGGNADLLENQLSPTTHLTLFMSSDFAHGIPSARCRYLLTYKGFAMPRPMVGIRHTACIVFASEHKRLIAVHVEVIVVEAEIMADLVDDGFLDLFDHVPPRIAYALMRPFVDGDHVGHDAAI